MGKKRRGEEGKEIGSGEKGEEKRREVGKRGEG
jgi:hypothetical protein